MPPVHRHDDQRSCGATTVVTGQSSVYSEGKLWAVEGDKDTHGQGGLIASHSGIYIEGKKIIVHAPDHANPDNLCPDPGGEHCDPKTADGSPKTHAYGD